MEEKCENCRYYNDDDLDNTMRGKCRRYPPVVEILISGDLNDISTDDYYLQPRAHKSDWCGEWKEIPKDK